MAGTPSSSRGSYTGSYPIVNADVDAAAAIAYSKLALTGLVANADIAAAAAVAYSKLSLTGAIVNADIAAAAAIRPTKFTAAGVRAFNSAAISINDSTTTALTYDSERFDTDAFHSTSSDTGRLTVPAGFGGLYVITACVEWAANAVGLRIATIRLNGATTIASVDANTVGASITTRLSVTTVYQLVATDYVEVTVFQNSTGALNVTATANMSPEFGMLLLGG